MSSFTRASCQYLLPPIVHDSSTQRSCLQNRINIELSRRKIIVFDEFLKIEYPWNIFRISPVMPHQKFPLTKKWPSRSLMLHNNPSLTKIFLSKLPITSAYHTCKKRLTSKISTLWRFYFTAESWLLFHKVIILLSEIEVCGRSGFLPINLLISSLQPWKILIEVKGL